MTSFSSGVKYAGSRLLLYGEHLDPSEIDRVSSIKSVEFHKKGELISGDNGTRKNGMWSIRRVGEVESFSDDLRYFIEALDRAPMPLTSINGVESVRVSLWIYESYLKDSLEILIDFEDLEKIHKIGAQLYITSFKDSGRE